MGRPKKNNAVKSGELAPGLCRVSYISEIDLNKRLDKICKDENIKKKDLLNEAVARYLVEYYKNSRIVLNPLQTRWLPLGE